MSEGLKGLAEERLSSADLWKFARHVNTRASSFNGGEIVIDLLTGKLGGRKEVLLMLTTRGIWMCPSDSPSPVGYKGESLKMVTIKSTSALEFLINPDAAVEGRTSFTFTDCDPKASNRFVAIFNLIALGNHWGNDDKIYDVLDTIIQGINAGRPRSPTKQTTVGETRGCLVFVCLGTGFLFAGAAIFALL